MSAGGPSIENLLVTLRALDKLLISSDGKASYYLETKKTANEGEVMISGNREGLTHLARLILEVAVKDNVGAHQHFDEAGDLDICEVPLIVCLKRAEWDS